MGQQQYANLQRKGRFIMWTQAGHQKQFEEISYVWIGLSTADITVAS
jgi:hypothetical protein